MTINTPEKASILIVDDMEENLVALEAVLGSLDQQLVRARSGEEALKAMLRQEFAVVLLDVMMPGMDGFETAANIKRLDQTKDVPIILLTGTEADTDYLYRGYAIGAADFLTKPFDPWLLRTKVNVFLDLYRKNRQLAAQAEQLRRLLVGAPTPAAPVGPAGSVESLGGARDRLSRARDAGAGASATAGSGQQLAEITERLAQIELQLRDAEGAEAVGLADRIADLERAVRSLRAGRDAY
ncbi:response regulator [Streptomyces sp. NBC_00841]|uniref:response regulator n=1 Tax=unclassified Streptomyces TaxID=2593676 RepID=UPI00225B4A51|nr:MULTISPECIES: response regulator [unclassified Streptomyces]MCX4530226.1 response regulator [Streptomyces sp. NBC_01669]WSA03995.1 response regulator [Streptomyces sp. NBC_00841]